MQHRLAVIAAGLFTLTAAVTPAESGAQQSLGPVAPSGQTANPVFEGWYRNADSSFSLSFGYFNRNAAEVLSIPLGPDNFMAPGDSNQGQPEFFYPRRHWGVFAVRVPADFGERRVVWTVKFRGKVFAIPGSLHRDWQIDALDGEAGSGNTPPGVTLDAGGPEARGPGGLTSAPRTATIGKPIMCEI